MQPPSDGRVVVVTGANRGIGYHLLAALVDDGYRVAGLDIEGESIEALAAEHPEHVRYQECDVRRDEDVDGAIAAVVEAWGRIDILVNNAAVLNFGFFDEQTTADVEHTFDVNFFGYLRTTHAVLPHMRAQGGGIIHNVSSGVGRVGNPGLTGYGATKGAIESFTRSLRLELQDTGIACTIMQPRLADTQGAAALDYPDSQLKSPEYVGRKLADEIESTRSVIYADWVTRLGLALAERVPWLVKRGTRRFLDGRQS